MIYNATSASIYFFDGDMTFFGPLFGGALVALGLVCLADLTSILRWDKEHEQRQQQEDQMVNHMMLRRRNLAFRTDW